MELPLLLYSNDMATALQTFDQAQGINQPLSLYIEAVKLSLANNILGPNSYPQGQGAYNTLTISLKICI
jgi:hypothetical protein